MKGLIVVALLSSMLADWGISTEGQQINTSQTYEYYNVHTDSSESYGSESYTSETSLEFSNEQHTRGTVEETQLSKIESEPIDKTVFMYRLFIVAMVIMIITILILNFIMNII